jgi:two-component system, OmpR family, phosphate regulon sensor histidine kinase PhoR
VKSVRSKITVTYVALALTIVVGVSVIVGYELDSYIKLQLIQDLSRQIDWIRFSLERDTSMTLGQIDGQIRRVAGIENLRITLITRDGSVIDDSDVPLDGIPAVENHLHRPEIQDALTMPVGSNIRLSATVGRNFLYVAKKVDNEPSSGALKNVAFIRLSMPLEEVLDRINSLRAIIAFAGIIVLIVVVGVSFIVSRRISNPMVQIAESVGRIRSGDLDTRIEITTRDEIGRVAVAINELVEKLKTDIAEVKKLQKVRSEFLGNVSHELRTPIFAIQGFIETLLNGAVDDSSVNRTFLEKAKANADRLNALLEDLINISQIESGEMKMSFRYFNLNEFLEMVVRDFQEMGRQKKISVSGTYSTAGDVEVLGDRDRLRQALNNLIDNAIKYSAPGAQVVVSSEEIKKSVRVSVTDTGVGIAAEHLTRIFERFYRVDKDRSREVGGTGLGLAIVKHIVEAHGSSIEVKSDVGRGSTFSFTLKK